MAEAENPQSNDLEDIIAEEAETEKGVQPEATDAITQEEKEAEGEPTIANLVIEEEEEQVNVTEAVIEDGAEPPEGTDAVIEDVVGQSNVKDLGDASAIAQGNAYQVMTQSSIQAIQNSVSLQQQLSLNNYAITIQNLNCVYSRKRGTAADSAQSPNRMFEIFLSLYPEYSSSTQGDQPADFSTPKAGSKRLQYLNDVLAMLKILQGIA